MSTAIPARGTPLLTTNIGRPRGFIMDVPFFNSETGVHTGYFVGAYANPWPGAVDFHRPVRDSQGNVVSFERILQIPNSSLMGEIIDYAPLGFRRYTLQPLLDGLPPGNFPPWVVDREFTMRIRLFDKAAQLESAGIDGMLDNPETQTIAVKGANKRWELKMWANARFLERDSEDYPIWELSGFMHGVNGTETITADLLPGDEVVFLNRDSLVFWQPPADQWRTYDYDLRFSAPSEGPGSLFANLIPRYPLYATLAYPPPVDISWVDLGETIELRWRGRSFVGSGGEALDSDSHILREGEDRERYIIFLGGVDESGAGPRIVQLAFASANEPRMILRKEGSESALTRYENYYIRIWPVYLGRSSLNTQVILRRPMTP